MTAAPGSDLVRPRILVILAAPTRPRLKLVVQHDANNKEEKLAVLMSMDGQFVARTCKVSPCES